MVLSPIESRELKNMTNAMWTPRPNCSKLHIAKKALKTMVGSGQVGSNVGWSSVPSRAESWAPGWHRQSRHGARSGSTYLSGPSRAFLPGQLAEVAGVREEWFKGGERGGSRVRWDWGFSERDFLGWVSPDDKEGCVQYLMAGKWAEQTSDVCKQGVDDDMTCGGQS